MRHRLLLIFLVSLLPLAFAAPLNTVVSAVSSLCLGLTSLLPIAAMLAVVLGGVIYAAGQMMGAETRARANVWATAALVGALFAVLIAVIAPAALSSIYGSSLSCTATGGGSLSACSTSTTFSSACACGSNTCSGSTGQQRCCSCSCSQYACEPSSASCSAVCTGVCVS